jgi:hypothetical protein
MSLGLEIIGKQIRNAFGSVGSLLLSLESHFFWSRIHPSIVFSIVSLGFSFLLLQFLSSDEFYGKWIINF